MRFLTVRSMRWLAFVLCMAVGLIPAALAQELPSGHGCDVITADVTGATDATQAFRTGIHPRGDQWSVTYVPPGTYTVSDSIAFTLDRARFFTMMGAGPEKTIIRLKANSTRFADTTRPKSVFFFRYSNNATHSVFLENLTIEIESGNPGAIAYRCGAHNGGGLSNVVFRAAAGSGFIGVDLEDTPGPEYLEDVKVYGFQKGIYLAGGMYSVTMARITVEGQRGYGIQNVGVPVQINRLTSNNTCRGIQSGGNGLTLIHATFSGGSAGQFAVVSTSSVFVRNLSIEGSAYTYSLGDGVRSRMLTDKTIAEYIGDSVRTLITSPRHPLEIPVNDLPVVAWDPPANWGNINSMGGFQAAITAGSKSTLFFPMNSAPSGGDVHVNNSAIKRIMGFGRDYPGTVYFDNPDPNSVVITDKLQFTNVVVSTPGKVILKGFTGELITISGTGETYFSDFCCGQIKVNGGKMWGWQVNTEASTPAFEPRIMNNGGQVTVIGIKTEGPDPVVGNTNGAKTNIFGGFVYPGAGFGVPDGPAFINDNSDLFLLHNQLSWTYPIYIREIRSGSATVEKTLTELGFSGACAYVTNPNGQEGVKQAGSTMVTRRQVVSTRAAVLVRTPDHGEHAVRVNDMQGRLVFVAGGVGAREYRFAGAGNAAYVVTVRAGSVVNVVKTVCGE